MNRKKAECTLNQIKTLNEKLKKVALPWKESAGYWIRQHMALLTLDEISMGHRGELIVIGREDGIGWNRINRRWYICASGDPINWIRFDTLDEAKDHADTTLKIRGFLLL
jgi:hypothetical protein